MRVTPRFTIRGLMAFVAVAACCLAAGRALGVVLATFMATLSICYALASALSVRARVKCAAYSLILAMLPWLGLGHGSFVLMGDPDRLLPTIEIPNMVHDWLSWPYWIAETPLYIASEYSHQFNDTICFAGEGLVTVRPFVVFVFWLGLALAFSGSLVSWLFSGRTRGPNPVGHCARQSGDR